MSKACFSILAIFILFSFFGYCQFALSGGLVYGAPFSLNKQGYYTSSIGLQVGLNYALSNSRVYPSLNFGVNSIQLPLQTPYYNNIGVTADDLNCMLHLNYKKTENTNYYFVYY